MPSNSLSRYDPSLIAHPSFEEGIEENIVPVLIKGSDESGMNRDLFFQITSLPENGVLMEPNSEHVIEVGDVLNQTDSYPWTGIVVHYKGNDNFFTSPQTPQESILESEPIYESFAFAVMAPMQNEVAIGTSSSVSNNITIVNVNDAPVLRAPVTTQSVNMFSSIHWNPTCEDGEDEEKNILSSPLDKECTNDNVIRGINIKDPDKDMNFVRVDIKSTLGIISLNQDHLQKAEFASCSARNFTNSTWKCQGNGIGNEEMTFISSPNHLNSLFSHILYERLTEGYDNISVSIYDGVGGDCLTADEHMTKYNLNNITGPYTIHSRDKDNSTCQKVEKSIPVHIVKKELEEKSKGIIDDILGDLPIQLWVAMIALVLSFALILFFSINCSKGGKRRKKRSKAKKSRGDRSKNVGKKDKRKYDAEDIVVEYSSTDSKKKEYKDALEENEITLGGISDQEDYEKYYEDGGYDEEMEKEEYYGEGEEEDLDNDYEGEQDISGCEWIQYFDSSSGDHYYENTRTRRVTWTKPNEPCINGDEG